VLDNGDHGGLLPVVLYERAIRAIRDTLSIRRTLAPVQLKKLFGDQSDRQVEFTSVISPELYGEVGNRDKQGIPGDSGKASHKPCTWSPRKNMRSFDGLQNGHSMAD
jgi:hypothetical protein